MTVNGDTSPGTLLFSTPAACQVSIKSKAWSPVSCQNLVNAFGCFNLLVIRQFPVRKKILSVDDNGKFAL